VLEKTKPPHFRFLSIGAQLRSFPEAGGPLIIPGLEKEEGKPLLKVAQPLF